MSNRHQQAIDFLNVKVDVKVKARERYIDRAHKVASRGEPQSGASWKEPTEVLVARYSDAADSITESLSALRASIKVLEVDR
jgi:hypothetical protein